MNFLNEAQTSNDGLVEYASSDQMEVNNEKVTLMFNFK